MSRAAPREDEIQDFRDRVVEVASTLFVERGYQGVTFRALTDGLGCSPMTPYRYFRDKDDIFAAVRTAAYNRFATTLESAAPTTQEPVKRLAEIGRAYARFGGENPDAYQLMFALRPSNPGDCPELRAAELRSRTPFYTAVHTAVESGDLVGDAEELAHICWASDGPASSNKFATTAMPVMPVRGSASRSWVTRRIGTSEDCWASRSSSPIPFSGSAGCRHSAPAAFAQKKTDSVWWRSSPGVPAFLKLGTQGREWLRSRETRLHPRSTRRVGGRILARLSRPTTTGPGVEEGPTFEPGQTIPWRNSAGKRWCTPAALLAPERAIDTLLTTRLRINHVRPALGRHSLEEFEKFRRAPRSFSHLGRGSWCFRKQRSVNLPIQLLEFQHMSIRNKLAIALVAFLAPFVFASTATAQAGAACSGTTCGLGGQLRGQIGDGLPLPISIAPAQGGSGTLAVSGPFTGITIQTAPATPNGLPLVGNGLGQPGQLKPSAGAVLTVTTAGAPFTSMNPQGFTMADGLFAYGGQPQGSIGVVNFNVAVFAVQTSLTYDTPHPGTTKLGAAAVTFAVTTDALGIRPVSGPINPGGNVLAAGGRAGAATVTYYAGAGALGSPTNNYGGTPATPTAMLGDGGDDDVNGIARFTSTGNQFGGNVIGRALGTARVYFNSAPLVPATDLPCKVMASPGSGTTAMGPLAPFNTGTDCLFGLSIVDLTASDATIGVAGGEFGGIVIGSAFMTATGVFTGTIGFNGTIIGQNNPVTMLGANLPFTGQGNKAVGMPLTTGKLSITVTDVVGSTSEMFVRTGTDARTAGGNGVVALVTGSMTQRDISGGNANRTWITLEIPEPSAIFAASAGLFALFGCHRLARRRS